MTQHLAERTDLRRMIRGWLLLAIWATVAPVAAKESAVQETPLTLPGAKSYGYKTVGDVALRLHVFVPPHHTAADRRPAILIFFGGGWVRGEPSQFVHQAEYLASRGMVAVLPDYRTQSRHRTSPLACVADGKSAMRWVRSHASELGVDPNRIAASGGSAGGHVAASTALLSGFDEADEDTKVSCMPNALVLFNPVIDTTETGYGHAKLGEHSREASPAHHVRAGLPPTIIFHGEADKTVRYENVQRFTAEMLQAGNECRLLGYPGKDHGFYRKQDDMYVLVMREVDKFLVGLGWLAGGPTLKP